jgi:hypothetical protein
MLITKTSRDTYQFDSDFFGPNGRLTFDDFSAARRFAAHMSAIRAQPVSASDIYAMQLIDESMRVLIQRYAPDVLMSKALSYVDRNVGTDSFNTTQEKFVSEFPPDEVYR